MLRGFWYPALPSAAIRGRAVRTTTLLGLPLVLGRTTEGQPWALEDACPHRGMPLSAGTFDGREVECCYHGWRFEPVSGQCRTIPSLAAGARLRVDRLFARALPAAEADGSVWVHVPEPEAGDEARPPVPRLPVFGRRYRITHLSVDIPCGVDHGVIGLIDPAHGPFVHASWFWRRRDSIHEKARVIEPIEEGFRIQGHAPSANSAPYKLLKVYRQPVVTTIEFTLPSTRIETIRCGAYWFSSRAVVTPVRTGESRIDFCAAWNVFRSVPFFVSIFRAFAKVFLGQDRDVIVRQAVGLRHAPHMTLIDDADRPAKWYFELKAALLEARRTGGPMKHPIPEPVTLRWRS
ncbi:MAG: aromatic ring-hydroxylating dioxygenase subunit alpha [Candidatus Rokubacteria bacterium]|nr:aromatic ring-hydroxylating dioxygenase subunit alpha [Candidatus Rokubacteria bacterium]